MLTPQDFRSCEETDPRTESEPGSEGWGQGCGEGSKDPPAAKNGLKISLNQGTSPPKGADEVAGAHRIHELGTRMHLNPG